ncbi:hypothetical protein DKX38_019796 [Salix brachista]|uniref:Uncharacterized protein n=1 Tax=Salix brachista TaxID=2182728 RepID=A0A5N5KH85_9ROSI|nr:hypothetical protein DKX38_019796 [Salix brachista]
MVLCKIYRALWKQLIVESWHILFASCRKRRGGGFKVLEGSDEGGFGFEREIGDSVRGFGFGFSRFGVSCSGLSRLCVRGSGFAVWGFRFGVLSCRLRVRGFGLSVSQFEVSGSGFHCSGFRGFGLRVLGFRGSAFRVWGFAVQGFQGTGFRVGFSRFRVSCSGFVVQGYRVCVGFGVFGVPGLGFGVSGSGFRGFRFGVSNCRFRVQGFAVQGFGFGVSGSGFHGSGFRGSRFGVSGSGIRCSGFRVSRFTVFGVQGFGLGRFRVSRLGFRVSRLGLRVSGSWFRVRGFKFRVWGSGFRVQGSRLSRYEVSGPHRSLIMIGFWFGLRIRRFRFKFSVSAGSSLGFEFGLGSSEGFAFGVSSFEVRGFAVRGFRGSVFRVRDFAVRGFEFRVGGSGYGVSGFRGSGFNVWGSRFGVIGVVRLGFGVSSFAVSRFRVSRFGVSSQGFGAFGVQGFWGFGFEVGVWVCLGLGVRFQSWVLGYRFVFGVLIRVSSLSCLGVLILNFAGSRFDFWAGLESDGFPGFSSVQEFRVGSVESVERSSSSSAEGRGSRSEEVEVWFEVRFSRFRVWFQLRFHGSCPGSGSRFGLALGHVEGFQSGFEFGPVGVLAEEFLPWVGWSHGSGLSFRVEVFVFDVGFRVGFDVNRVSSFGFGGFKVAVSFCSQVGLGSCPGFVDSCLRSSFVFEFDGRVEGSRFHVREVRIRDSGWVVIRSLLWDFTFGLEGWFAVWVHGRGLVGSFGFGVLRVEVWGLGWLVLALSLWVQGSLGFARVSLVRFKFAVRVMSFRVELVVQYWGLEFRRFWGFSGSWVSVSAGWVGVGFKRVEDLVYRGFTVRVSG